MTLLCSDPYRPFELANREGLAEFKKATFDDRFPELFCKMWETPDKQMKQFWKIESRVTIYCGIRFKDEFVIQSGPADFVKHLL